MTGCCRWTFLAAAITICARAATGADCDVDDLEEQCFNFYDNPRSWNPKFDMQDIINSFAAGAASSSMGAYGDEGAFPPTERTQDGISFVPGLEVRVAKKPGCTFAGAVMLSESEDCQGDPQVASQVEEMESARSNNYRFLLTLPEARTNLFTGQPNMKFKDTTAEKVNLRLFFCVRAGPVEEFKPMHLVWYVQDKDPEGPTSIWEAPDAKLHETLNLLKPQLWRDEERYRMVPIDLEGITTDIPAYSYTLMHFKARSPGDGPMESEAGSGAVPQRLDFFATLAVCAAFVSMYS